MQKEYNSWNLLKQKLDSKKRNRWTNLRDVWKFLEIKKAMQKILL